ncbi:hypothetical protein KKF91_13505, partial [Myxococcota bacterium]|nr:hypothetical protein [Myxococcota bacterium]
MKKATQLSLWALLIATTGMIGCDDTASGGGNNTNPDIGVDAGDAGSGGGGGGGDAGDGGGG